MTAKDTLLQKNISIISRVFGDEQVLIWSWPQLTYFFSAVLACFLLTLAIQYGNSYYNPISIRLLSGSVILSTALIPLLFWAEPGSTALKYLSNASTTAVLVFTNLLLIFVLILGLQDIYLHYNQNPLFPTFAKGMGWLTTLLLVTYLVQFNRAQLRPATSSEFWLTAWTNFINYRFAIIILLNLVLKIAAVLSSYRHFIDVGIMMQESSAHFLAGQNPYSTATTWLAGFIYLPLGLLLPLPFYIAFGDTRFGSIFWELIGICFIYQLIRKELSFSSKLIRLAELILLFFLLQPRGLFVIEQSWGEPVIVGVMAVALYFFYYRPTGPLADILLAALLALKQYLIFMGLPLFILYNLKLKRYAITVLVFILILLPFFVWNPGAFFNQTVLHYFRIPDEPTSLGLLAFFAEQGISLPRWISPIAAGVVALGLGLLLKRFDLLGYLTTLILTFFCLFIFGQQAFANYYYLISFLQVTAIIFFLVHHFPNKNYSHLKTV